MQQHVLAWLRPDAPYAPFVQIGLLACLRGHDDDAAVRWDPDPSGFSHQCVLTTTKTLEAVADAIVAAPWPDLSALPWPSGFGQAIKPVLAKAGGDQVALWRALTGPPIPLVTPPRNDGEAGARHVAALLTDGALDDAGAPSRSRLLRGVKADLSGVKPIKLRADALARELRDGPTWVPSGAGSGLGLVPEVQTYGGVTGPKPDSIKSSSALLHALIVHALGALPPFGVLRGSQRSVGGPLVGDRGALVWPIHTTDRDLRSLVALYGSDDPRGVDCVYRSSPRAVNSMISMFPWGELVTA